METFYASEDFGKEDDTFLYAFTTRRSRLARPVATPSTRESCSFRSRRTRGKQVFLGPFLKPLLDRPDLVDRMRIVVNRHTLEPHEAAIPLAISGRSSARRRSRASAHVQRYFVDRETEARGASYSYGFATAGGFIPTDNVLAGRHGFAPGSARPLLIKVDNVTRLNQLLERTSVSSIGAIATTR